MKVSMYLLALSVALIIGIGTITPGHGQASRNGLTIEAVVLQNANLRAGPGLDQRVIGAAYAGRLVTVTDQTRDWYQLSTGEWIAKFLVAPTFTSRVVAFGSKEPPPAAPPPTSATIYHEANLRSGPGTSYPIVDRIQPQPRLDLLGQDQTGDWLLLRNGMWIATFLVAGAPTDLPVMDVNSITPTPTPPPAEPSATPTSVFLVPPVTPNAIQGTHTVVIQNIVGMGVVSRVESDEYAVITNGGTASINIGGWRLHAGGAGQDLIFSNFTLAPYQSLRVYTDEIHPETGGFSFGSHNPLWNNAHDCGYLFDAIGNQVSSFCY